jgi:2-aminoadipate transaminase
MNWNQMFAQRTGQMKRTAVRELLKVAARPEIISFAGGLPAAELFPVVCVGDAVTRILERFGGTSLQYGETEGLATLRQWVATEFTKHVRSRASQSNESSNLAVRPENVLITSGAQQALDLVGRILLEKGDRVVVENPTYLALLSAWRPHGVEFLPVPSDADGMCVEALESPLSRRPKLIYLTPNFQNPQGTTLSLDRRKQLLRFAAQWGAGIVEDNPYGDLRYDGESVPHLLTLEASRSSPGPRFDSSSQSPLTSPRSVIYIGSFSKVLMPGLRVGWVVAAPEVIEKLVSAKQAADLHTNSLGQHIVLELLTQGFLDEFLPRLKETYRQRRDAMLEALERFFPRGVSWTRPDGGMFLMARLPTVDTAALLPQALEQGVAYVPGEEFHLDCEGRNTMRLNFSNARPEQIKIGIERLGKLVAAERARPAQQRSSINRDRLNPDRTREKLMRINTQCDSDEHAKSPKPVRLRMIGKR